MTSTSIELARRGEIVLRTSTEQDVPALVRVRDAVTHTFSGRPTPLTPALVALERGFPGRDPERDIPVVEADGVVIGAGNFYAAAPYSELFFGVSIDPALDDSLHRASTELLLEYAVRRCTERLDGMAQERGGRVVTDVFADDRRTAAVTRGLGWSVVGHAWEMAKDLSGEPVPSPEWPSDVTVARITPERVGAVNEVFAEAFLDHVGDMHVDVDMLAAIQRDDGFHHGASCLVSDSEGPVAALMGSIRSGIGHVDLVGVRRRARRRGLASAMLRHALGNLRADGVSWAVLEVDAESVTGATRVYESAGMVAVTTMDVWGLPLPGP